MRLIPEFYEGDGSLHTDSGINNTNELSLLFGKVLKYLHRAIDDWRLKNIGELFEVQKIQ